MDSALHDTRYSERLLATTAESRLSATTYSSYPISVYDGKDLLIVCEGRIYNLSETELASTLRDLATIVFGHESTRSRKIAEWLPAHDGDFVIALHNKADRRWAILTDSLGRLPVYYCRHASRYLLTREISVACGFVEHLRLDALGVAQSLVFGYSLGHRTIYADVERLPSASFALWEPEQQRLRMESVHTFDFSQTGATAIRDDHARELVDLFARSCASRVGAESENVLSLSGGLDSRSVAAGLLKANCDFRAVTFLNAAGSASADAAIAEQLADALQISRQLFKLKPPTGSDLRTMLQLKCGLVNTGNAIDIEFLGRVRELHAENLTFFTGDGGDKLLPNLFPARSFRSVRHLARYIVDRHAILPPSVACELAGVSEQEFAQSLMQTLESYPEETFRDQYVHFMIYERAMKWLFEAEDRNRCEFWCAAPFYGLDFFRAAMTCPAGLKRGHQLYRRFLELLSPEVMGIVDAGRGLPLDSSAYRRRLKLAAIANRYPRLARRVRAVLTSPAATPPDSPKLALVRALSAQSSVVRQFVDIDGLSVLFANSSILTPTALETLLTFLGAIDVTMNDGAVLGDYLETEF